MKKEKAIKIYTGEEERKMINKVSAVGIFGNFVLVAFKLIAGFFGHSGAMISDAVHSLSDVFATIVAFLGVRMSKKAADTEHPYGHERIECIASLLLGLILLVTGLAIGVVGAKKIIAGNYDQLVIPETIALVAAVVSIASKEAMYWYTRHYAKLLRSEAFMADAWHHRSDAFSSVASLIGIGGAMLGYPVMDPVASVVICIFILKVGASIITKALANMMDTSCGQEYETQLREYIETVEGVEGIDLLQTRKFGNKIYIDVEIRSDGNQSLKEAHGIAEKVHDGVESEFADIKHIMIHVNPA